MTVSAVRGRSKGRSRCCSHPRGPSIPAPGSSTTPARAVEPAILTPPVPAPSLSGAEGLPAVTVPDRQLPGVPAATPAIGTSSSESADDNRPNRVGRLTPAQPVVPDKLRLPVAGPSPPGLQCKEAAAALQQPLLLQLSTTGSPLC